jgi:hypothetical protein
VRNKERPYDDLLTAAQQEKASKQEDTNYMTNNVFAIWYEKSSDRQNIRHGQY